MSKLAAKMRQNLESMKLVPHKAAIAELNAKADAAEKAGHQGSHTELKWRIFNALVEIMPSEVQWVESHFVRGELTIETYTDYSKDRTEEMKASGQYHTMDKPCMHFGWRGGDFEFIGKLKGFSAYVDYKDTYEDTGSWRRTGKFLGTRIYVGNYGSKSQFKQLKGGLHRYADIAKDIKARAEQYKEMIRKEIQKRRNADAVTEVKMSIDHEFKDYNGIRLNSSTNPDLPVSVTLDVTKTLTAEQATELLNLLHKFNIG